MRFLNAGPRALGLVVAVACIGLGAGLPAHGRTLPAPPPDSSPGPPGIKSGREDQLEARVRQLEDLVRDLSGQVERLSPPAMAAPGAATDDPTSGAPTIGSAGINGSTPPQPARFEMPAPVGAVPLTATFGPGFELKSADDEYQFQFHDLFQLDGRFYEQGGQTPVHDTFGIPRQWFIFSGRLTKPIEYYAALAQGFDTLNVLDLFANIHYDDRLQLKIGRFFVPFTYELYAVPIQALITPERSLFFNNFGLNRDPGVMAWGTVARKRVDYAVGIFNGPRNAFLDTNDAKDVVAYLNARPFGAAGIPALEYLNIGGSVDFGNQLNAPSPATLRTLVPAPGNATVGVPFLAWNPDVREAGDRALWSLHVAYYYRHLSFIGEWESGFQDYAHAGTPTNRIHLPIQSGYVEAGDFLTGETVASRGLVKPLRDFDLRPGRRGPGAWEAVVRYNVLDLGDRVFTAGLADPNLWTDRLATVDVGFNWYWTQFVKLSLFWEHAEFSDPVLYRPGARQRTSDLFLVRFQIRF
jgi:phosphate-selective porin OprO/OprP